MSKTIEYFDVYDSAMNKTGKKVDNFSSFANGEYGYMVHVIIRCNGKYLLQQRSLSKKFYAGQWDATCGKVSAGESGIEGAIREVKEELGLSADKNEFTLFYHGIYQNAVLLDIFLLEKDFKEEDLVLCKEEVEAVKFCDFEETVEILTPTKGEDYINTLYKIENG